MAQMQPIIDLSQTVRLLPELEKNKATAMSKTQAKNAADHPDHVAEGGGCSPTTPRST